MVAQAGLAESMQDRGSPGVRTKRAYVALFGVATIFLGLAEVTNSVTDSGLPRRPGHAQTARLAGRQ